MVGEKPLIIKNKLQFFKGKAANLHIWEAGTSIKIITN